MARSILLISTAICAFMALIRTRLIAGNSNPARIAMITITTSISTRVNAADWKGRLALISYSSG